MATPTNAAPAPMPESPRTWQPDEGNVISTVRCVRVSDAYLAVEHPADWTPEQLSAALTRRRGDICRTASWWDADETTDVVEAVMGLNDPDDPSREPMTLEAGDLAERAPVQIVEEFSEDE